MTTQIIQPNVDATFLATLATLAGKETLSKKTLKAPYELVTVSASAPASTMQYDTLTQSILYYTSNNTTNFTWNIRGNSGATLDSTLAIGEAMTIVLMVTNGATPYYPTAYTVDGASITPKYQNSYVINQGNPSAIDIYTLTLIKTASATYTALVSQTAFA
jgi:hypothetical protein